MRELENLLHRAVALSGGEMIERDDLGLPDDAFGRGAEATASTWHCDDEPRLGRRGRAGTAGAGALPDDLVAYLDDVERDILVRALERHRFNRTAAGASLGLSLRQMRYRMARLGVTSRTMSASGTAERPPSAGEARAPGTTGWWRHARRVRVAEPRRATRMHALSRWR